MLCVLLIASLWRGPVPLCHVHATAGASDEQLLSGHLQWFHQRGCSSDCPALGWHWHFVPASDIDGDGESDDETEARLSSTGTAVSRDDGITDGVPEVELTAWRICEPHGTLLGSNSRVAQSANRSAPVWFRTGLEVRLLACVNLC
jgi:hypothetical protein